MNPHQRNKIDVSNLSEEQQRLFRLYGKLPRTALLEHKLKDQRKYFDSGDYALSKAGKTSTDEVVPILGTEHPQAENIPHLSPSSPPNSVSMPPAGGGGSIRGGADGGSHFLPGTGGHRGSIHGIQGGSMDMSAGQRRSPAKESSYLARSASIDEGQDKEAEEAEAAAEEAERFNFGDADQGGEQDLHRTSVSPPPMKEGLPIRG